MQQASSYDNTTGSASLVAFDCTFLSLEALKPVPLRLVLLSAADDCFEIFCFLLLLVYDQVEAVPYSSLGGRLRLLALLSVLPLRLVASCKEASFGAFAGLFPLRLRFGTLTPVSSPSSAKAANSSGGNSAWISGWILDRRDFSVNQSTKLCRLKMKMNEAVFSFQNLNLTKREDRHLSLSHRIHKQRQRSHRH